MSESCVYIGIDSGLLGAVAAIGVNGDLHFDDTPLGKEGQKQVYDVAGMVELLRQIAPVADRCHVAIEKVHAMPSTHAGDLGARMGTTSAFRMGYGLALWVGIVAALRLPYTLVPPQTWKREMLQGVSDAARKDKDVSRQVAMQMFPSAIPQLSRKRDHGRGDALLLAEYIRRELRF